VVYGDGRYVLNPELSWWVDLDEFLGWLKEADAHRAAGRRRDAVDAYSSATELYRGPLFEDDTLSEWHLAEQRHLEDRHFRALEELGELHLELEDPTVAVEAGQRVLAGDPCRESAHRLLMRCYAAQYQQHLVSRQLQMCVTALRRRFGVSPTAETFRLYRELTTDT
jgi:DNA-binding SARP family transcriptional activator